jgi:hypothetical protein
MNRQRPIAVVVFICSWCAKAKARLDRINTVMQQDVADASVADALKSELIIKLRGQPNLRSVKQSGRGRTERTIWRP